MAGHLRAGYADETDDEWYERGWSRHVAAPAPPRTTMLAPDRYDYGRATHQRSRSTGARPAPNVTVYNSIRNEDEHPTYSGQQGSHRRSGSRYETEELVDAIDGVAREVRRGRSPAPGMPMMAPGMMYPPREQSPYLQMELVRQQERQRGQYELEREREHLENELARERLDARERAETEAQLIRTRAEIRRLKERLQDEELEEKRRDDQDKYKRDIEYERLKDNLRRQSEDARRKEERTLIIMEQERKEREDKERKRRERLEYENKKKEEEEEEKALIQGYQVKQDAKKRAEKEREEAAIAAYHKKQAEEKKKREDLMAQFKREEDERKEKEKKEKEMWRLRIEKEEEDKKKKKKEEEEKVDEAMRKKLAKFGFQNNQVEAILDDKKANALRPGQSPGNPIRPGNQLAIAKPTYIRIHRNHIDVETLRYFGLPYEYDTHDSNYIVILQEIDHHETEILFEHTRKLRKGASSLLIEDRGRKNHPQYAFVRRRSVSRRKSSPKRVSVNLGGLFG
ncbi:hypothetical protein BT63DRAFT_426410 [Microthyrium microscopicum]|uniref:Uncharacterized protein n=1 Tax=Microthyrium microscopicum TaxID=703497 RepID=A0A6A6U5I0_9PEZI|nr:hypothetical protein BT63DRAFT_426410 [Microthyrium microscopicum]